MSQNQKPGGEGEEANPEDFLPHPTPPQKIERCGFFWERYALSFVLVLILNNWHSSASTEWLAAINLHNIICTSFEEGLFCLSQPTSRTLDNEKLHFLSADVILKVVIFLQERDGNLKQSL